MKQTKKNKKREGKQMSFQRRKKFHQPLHYHTHYELPQDPEIKDKHTQKKSYNKPEAASKSKKHNYRPLSNYESKLKKSNFP